MTRAERLAARRDAAFRRLATYLFIAAFAAGFGIMIGMAQDQFPCAEDEWLGYKVGCVHNERIGPDGMILPTEINTGY